MTDNFGGGIYLTNQGDLAPEWDMAIDPSGDIQTTTGLNELQKDVAYATAVEVDGELGGRIEPVVLNRVRARVRDVLEDEERIDSILTLQARDAGNDTIEITTTVVASDEEIELVFEV